LLERVRAERATVLRVAGYVSLLAVVAWADNAGASALGFVAAAVMVVLLLHSMRTPRATAEPRPDRLAELADEVAFERILASLEPREILCIEDVPFDGAAVYVDDVPAYVRPIEVADHYTVLVTTAHRRDVVTWFPAMHSFTSLRGYDKAVFMNGWQALQDGERVDLDLMSPAYVVGYLAAQSDRDGAIFLELLTD
jgi:hypothetical protein